MYIELYWSTIIIPRTLLFSISSALSALSVKVSSTRLSAGWNDQPFVNECVFFFFFQDSIGRRRARAAMRHWQKHTCLRFKRVKDPPEDLGHINFVFEGG